jgi:hypothetical protein
MIKRRDSFSLIHRSKELQALMASAFCFVSELIHEKEKTHFGCERSEGGKELESLTSPNKHRFTVRVVHVNVHRDLHNVRLETFFRSMQKLTANCRTC